MSLGNGAPFIKSSPLPRSETWANMTVLQGVSNQRLSQRTNLFVFSSPPESWLLKIHQLPIY